MMPRTEQITLLQMDGEITKEGLMEALELAKKALKKIYEVQKNAIKQKYELK